MLVTPMSIMLNTFANVFEINIILLVSFYFKEQIMKTTHLRLFH